MNIWKNRDWSPMLLKEISEPFNSENYLFELKFDGIRAIIFANNKEVKVQSRNKQDMTYLFPELQEIKNIVNKNVIFDGEIVTFQKGYPSFSNLQKRMHLKNISKIKKEQKNNPVTYVAFDILFENKELIKNSLLERKKYLNKYLDTDYFVKTKIIENKGKDLFKKVKNLGLEGIVAKNKNGLYHIDKRTDDFIKIKNIQRDEFVIGGYTLKKDAILSLTIGEYQNNKLVYVGKVIIRKKNKLYDKILKMPKTKSYFENYDDDEVIFIKPTLTCHVEYLERSINNLLRHPVYKDI